MEDITFREVLNIVKRYVPAVAIPFEELSEEEMEMVTEEFPKD